MKLNSKIILALTAMGALVWTGCQTTQFPTSYLSATGPNLELITDFESGFVVNSQLAEANRPNNRLVAPGTISLGGYSSSVVTLAPSLLVLATPGSNGVGQCAHVTGSFIDPGTQVYPALSLNIPLEAANQYYDASLFTGVKFYIKTGVADAAVLRTLSIPIALTTVSGSGGVCDQPPFTSANNPCYNNFIVNYASTNGAWAKATAPFSSFTRGNYGAPITPSNLTGDNLKQVLMLSWSEGNQNAAGTVNVDFELDDVEFY